MERSENHEPVLPLLSPRLRAIADMVTEKTDRIIDIGTDHAYLPIWLAGRNTCSTAIASDLRSGPVARAKSNIDKYGMSDRIEARIGDGLEDIALCDGDTVIIAGMGGLEIMKILDSRLDDIPAGLKLILQPQRSIPELRSWLIRNGFSIEDESIIRDRKHFYTVIKVSYSNINGTVDQEFDTLSAWLGPVLLRKNQDMTDDPLWQEYLQDKRTALAKAVRGKPELADLLKQIEQMLA
ncbi:MAG: SAM-dependent methyltransferase [Clostridiaceae bacterium]|nr:SAM-dependent methyltransferase [Clostridiaceae bacterium]